MENSGAQTNKPKSNTLLIVLLGVMIAIGGWLGYSNNQLQKQLDDCGVMAQGIEEEKGLVVDELEGMLTKYDSLQGTNDSVNAELTAERERVEQLLAEAKNNRYSIYKLKKETETLRGIMKGYVRTIDSLNTMNVELRAENASVRQQYNDQVDANEDLQQQNQDLSDKVKIGSKLKSFDMITVAQRVKSNGVHRETNRASKATTIKNCFTIDRNDVTQPGNKVLYMRIITPNGKVLSDGTGSDNMFDMGSNKGLFSVKKKITYERQELDVCMYREVKNTLPVGEYKVEVWEAGMQIGETTFTLK